MTDVEKVREALAYLQPIGPVLRAGLPTDRAELLAHTSQLSRVIEAARLWVVSQDAPRIWWCEEHGCSGGPNGCQFRVTAILDSYPGQTTVCRPMVERLLVSPSPTKEGQ
jgi:hypothetical protein